DIRSATRSAVSLVMCLSAILTSPCISCAITCTNASAPDGLIMFSGTVQNCSTDSTLVNVTATNWVDGIGYVPLTLSTTTLGPGATATCTGSYTHPHGCGPVTNTVFVRGSDQASGAVAANFCSSTCSSPCPGGNELLLNVQRLNNQL